MQPSGVKLYQDLHEKLAKGEISPDELAAALDAGSRDERYQDAPIISITEVIAALRQRAVISEEEYFRLLLKLRAGSIRYIPLTQEEILFHLNQAKVIDRRLVETQALSTLRKYVSDAFFNPDLFQIPLVPEGSANLSGELGYLLETTGAVVDSFVATWSDEGVSALGLAPP